MFFYFGHRRKWAWTWPTKHDSINLHQFTHLLREVCRAKNIWKGEWAQIHCLARATACYSLNMLRSCYSSPCVVQLGSKDCQSNGSVRVWRLAMMRSRRLPPALTCARSMCNMCNMCIPKLSSQVGSKGNQTVSWSNANLDETCMQPGIQRNSKRRPHLAEFAVPRVAKAVRRRTAHRTFFWNVSWAKNRFWFTAPH